MAVKASTKVSIDGTTYNYILVYRPTAIRHWKCIIERAGIAGMIAFSYRDTKACSQGVVGDEFREMTKKIAEPETESDVAETLQEVVGDLTDEFENVEEA